MLMSGSSSRGPATQFGNVQRQVATDTDIPQTAAGLDSVKSSTMPLYAGILIPPKPSVRENNWYH